MILAIENLTKSFGSVTVADGIDLSVEEGAAVGIIGPNGAGKSSLFNLITGDVAADTGTIRLDGTDITSLPPESRCRAGIGRSYQVPKPFETLTVFENLLVGAMYGRGMTEAGAVPHCAGILESTGLADRANRLAGSLTLLERKRLEMARALSTQPRILLLDEIAGGLTDEECGVLVGTIADVNASGITIVWIEHIVHALLAAVGRLVVLDAGRIVADGEPRTVIASREVQETYMGLAD